MAFILGLIGYVRVYYAENVGEVHSRQKEELIPKQGGGKELSMSGNNE